MKRLLEILILLCASICQAAPPDGSILFWKGGLLVKPISKSTGSTITHATIILNGFVYEAVPPVVHKVPFDAYIKSMANHKRKDFSYFIEEPKIPFNIFEIYLMRKYAESQLGRTYMMRGYWKGYEVRGIMCSQFAGNTLEKSGLIKSNNFKESPGSLYQKILPYYEERN